MQDTVTGFLLAGVGSKDIRKNTNYLVVDSSASLHVLHSMRLPADKHAWRRCRSQAHHNQSHAADLQPGHRQEHCLRVLSASSLHS